jgi:exonuclease III
LAGGKSFSVLGLHLHAGETLADEAVRLTELPAILEAAEQLRAAGRPWAMLGDFNAHHPEQVIDLARVRAKTRARIAAQSEVIPRELIGRLLEVGYLDAHGLFFDAAQFQSSLTTRQPALRVDYALVPPEWRALVRGCTYPVSAMGKYASDHFPVLLELDV